MTATTKTTTAPTLRRNLRVAGLVAASAAAVTASLTPQATAAGHDDSGNERQASPTAFTVQDTKATGKSLNTTGHDAPERERDDTVGSGAETTAEPKPEPKSEREAAAAQDAAQRGRGAHYTADGELIPIEHGEQPEPVPADDADIDRWIKQALKIMDEHQIPGSYEGIHSNLMRESAGDPLTINMWDTNAQENIPSKGLLQVIDPTFDAYHVPGTDNDPFDPVANITAAANYAADRYGSMDNVNSAY